VAFCKNKNAIKFYLKGRKNTTPGKLVSNKEKK